ncbi:DegV family protein [uncultured Neglectibacter sp.]|uniref:DegV family protein n=1 Tax=uncultured Neglectibacter sp. TaxID=1924108 RepID=UPI0034E00005
MAEYQIITDSTTDISPEMIAELGVQVIPLCYMMEGKTFHNIPGGGEMDEHTFYEKLRSGSTSTTAQINSEEFLQQFTAILESGKDVLYLAFSSGLSGTCQSAMIARQELQEKFPERRIMVFDTLCASMGEGLLVYHAATLQQAGKTMEEVYAWLQENVLHLCHWFTVDDLNHLKRGGRVSAATALVGTMLGIKPVLHVDDEGHLINVSKARGRKQSLDALVKKMEETAIDPKNQTVFISHGDCLEDAQYVAGQVKEKFGTTDIRINFIGPVIGAHSGPGTVALFFLGSRR